MTPKPRPLAFLIAGPNGSGKTTASATLLPEGVTFVNADLIAQEESGERSTMADISAGRKLIELVEGLVKRGEDFAMETTLSSRLLLDRVRGWQRDGYQVHVLFFYLPSPELAVERVRGRVAEGGHDVPEETIRRRYRSGLKLFLQHYLDLADAWRFYDNSTQGPPRLIARKNVEGERRIPEEATWNRLTMEAAR